MKNMNISTTLSNLRSLGLCAFTVLLASCATTSLKNTWKSPQSQGPVGKIAVLFIEERGMLRQGFENRFITQLSRGGTTVVPTYDQLSLAEIKKDKQAAAERLRASGAEAVLIVRLASLGTSYREVRPGSERYAETITGFENVGWYDYYSTCYSVAFMDMSPTYGNLKAKVYIEAGLFDLQAEKPVWTGLTLTVLKETTDRVAEMDPIVAKIVDAMRKDGVVR